MVVSKLLQFTNTIFKPVHTRELLNSELIREKVYTNLLKNAEQRNKFTKAKGFKFKIGDQVMIKIPRTSKPAEYKFAKFYKIYDGPHTIVKLGGPNSYWINIRGEIKGTYHARHLKPFYSPSST